MTLYAEFNEYLGMSFSDDYWSDEGAGYAYRLIRDFDELDWGVPRSSWQNRDEEWQLRCVQSSPQGDPHFSLPIAMDILRSDSKVLHLPMLDGMREMDLSYLDTTDVKQVRIGIEQCLQHSSEIESIVLKQLYDQIAMR